MPQCPLCKRNAPVENGRCGRCQGDVSVLQSLRDLPAHLYNAGLEAARNGQPLDAILKVAAAAQLSERPESWLVLGKLFANEGVEGHAQACFTKAQELGAAAPEDWLGRSRTPVPAAELRVDSSVEGRDADDLLVTKGSETSVEATPMVSRGAARPALARWVFAVILLGTGIGLGWQMRAYRTATLAPHPASGLASSENPVSQPDATAKVDQAIPAPEVSALAGLVPDMSAPVQPPADAVPREDLAPPPITPPSPASPAVEVALPAASDRYIVQAGDSLWQIARSRLGSGRRWHALYEANRAGIADPDRLVVGQVLIVRGVE